MSVYERPCRRKTCQGRKKKCKHRHWYYDFQLGGVQYRGAVQEARTRPQAEQAETRIKNDVFEGKYGVARMEPILFSEFVKKTYLPYAREHKRSFKTDEWRSEILVKHFGKKYLHEITKEMIDDFKMLMRNSITQYKRRRSPRDVNSFIEILSRIFSLAVENDRLVKNPCAKIEFFTLVKALPRYFTYEEEERILAAATGTLAHLKPYVIVGIHAGLRPPSEIFGLKKSDVDFERNVLRAGTKTDEEREIPMSTEVREALLELHEANKESEYFFVNRSGRQMKLVKNGFRKLLNNAKVKKASSYTMRHTFGTRLGEAGYNAYEIMELMGHRDIKTSKIYVHPTDARKRAAVESISRAPHQIPAAKESGVQLQVVNG